jgi:predicted permease
MSFQRRQAYWTSAIEFHGNSITICSCIAVGTKLEQNPTKREIMVMWIKDAAAGAGLVLFMVSAFLLASGAHAALSHLPI